MNRKNCQCEYCECEGDEKSCPSLQKISQLNDIINAKTLNKTITAKATWSCQNGSEPFMAMFEILRKVGVFVYEAPSCLEIERFGVIVSNKELTEEQVIEADK